MNKLKIRVIIWNSVKIENSVEKSVIRIVGNSVEFVVMNIVGYSIWNNVGDGNSIMKSVGDSVSSNQHKVNKGAVLRGLRG